MNSTCEEKLEDCLNRCDAEHGDPYDWEDCTILCQMKDDECIYE